MQNVSQKDACPTHATGRDAEQCNVSESDREGAAGSSHLVKAAKAVSEAAHGAAADKHCGQRGAAGGEREGRPEALASPCQVLQLKHAKLCLVQAQILQQLLRGEAPRAVHK